MINSLTLKITDPSNNIITNGPGITVVLHIQQEAVEAFLIIYILKLQQEIVGWQ